MIDLYSWQTPNGRKVSIMLEEIGIDYNVFPINIGKDEQFQPHFLEISPNNRIPAIIEPGGIHAILYGHGSSNATLEYLPENHKIKKDDKVYTSGKEGVFSPGIPIGEVLIKDKQIEVLLFSNLDQITFVNVDLADVGVK